MSANISSFNRSFLCVLFIQFMLVGTLSAQRLEMPQLLDSIQKIMKKHQIPGVMLSMVQQDSVLFEGGVGLADVEKNEKVTADHVFRLGSVTKTFTALAILQMEKQNKFSIHDHLLEIAPELPVSNPWESTHPLKIIHLLEHSAGFDDMHFNAIYRKDTLSITHLSAVEQHKKSLTCRWQPGMMSSYSNPGYVVLGYLIEKFGGMPYEQYVYENVLSPLGMQSAHFSIPFRFSATHARGYLIQPKGGAKKAEFNQIYGNAASGLCASAKDMSIFLQFLLRDGLGFDISHLDSSVLTNMRFAQSTLAARSGIKGGYGKAMYRSMLSSRRPFFGHSGGVEGFITYYGIQPELGTAYAFSINSMSSVRELSKLLADQLTLESEEHDFNNLPVNDQIKELLEEFTGYYSVANPRNELFAITDYLFGGIEIRLDGDSLLVKSLFNKADKYSYSGNGGLVLHNQQVPSLFLLKDETGKRWIEGDAFYQPDSFFLARFWLIVLGSGFILGMVLAPFGLVWCIMLATKGLDWREFQIRISPVVALASLMGLIFAFSVLSGDVISAGEISLLTVSVTTLSVTFFVFGNYALYQQIRYFRRNVHWGIPLMTIPASISYALFSWLMLYYGLIGIMVWNY